MTEYLVQTQILWRVRADSLEQAEADIQKMVGMPIHTWNEKRYIEAYVERVYSIPEQ